MPIPIVPLVVLGVGVLVFRRRKRAAKKTGDKAPEAPFVPINTVVFLPPKDRAPTGPSGQPGQPCKATDGEGAWDDLGACKTFWVDGETDEAIRALVREEWEARGRPGFSDLCFMVEDPSGGELAPPIDNPTFVAIVVAALSRYYDVGPLFPPTVANVSGEPTSPYWVHKAWAQASAVAREELCPS
jgi:hypothetical protein